MSRVLVAGSINMDVVATAERHPSAGETVPGKALHFFPGGKGANQAVAAAKLGANLEMIGKLGSDGFANDLESFLESQKVELRHVSRTAEAATGTALIVVADSGENTIVVVPGANGLFNQSDIDGVYIEPEDILVSQFEIPFDVIEHFFAKGHAVGAIAILNPAPALAGAERLLNVADVVVVNETELAFYLELAQLNEDSIKAAARDFQKKLEQTVIVTLGDNGVIVLDGNDLYHVPGRKVEAVDTTGAGDCFVGALAAQLSRNVAMKDAVTYANVAASICVQRLGAGPSMPTSGEVNQVFDEV
jgi:ribokinase